MKKVKEKKERGGALTDQKAQEKSTTY